ncbi:hypothetical protein TcasGA2_TC000564 [Tribolium castaneum]|uniref:Uncharacterized protein n=1 Tax=Tribolium castaneum TaxID=7070 RepID=D6W9K3_TRICA|nr:hypothetical protein TcasGA2_TC000564 [Tribolium castaneum]
MACTESTKLDNVTNGNYQNNEFYLFCPRVTNRPFCDGLYDLNVLPINQKATDTNLIKVCTVGINPRSRFQLFEGSERRKTKTCSDNYFSNSLRSVNVSVKVSYIRKVAHFKIAQTRPKLGKIHSHSNPAGGHVQEHAGHHHQSRRMLNTRQILSQEEASAARARYRLWDERLRPGRAPTPAAAQDKDSQDNSG